MNWYWWLVIAAGIILILLLIYFFGSKEIKKLAYELVCNAEKLIGEGEGQEKYNLVLENLSKLTKGIIPTSLLKKAIELGVSKMKDMLLEDPKSIQKRLKEKENG